MLQRLDHRHVGIRRLHVLANQGDVDRRLLPLGDNVLPVLPEHSALDHVRMRYGHIAEIEADAQKRKKLLLLEEDRDLIDGGHIADDENLIDLHGAVQRELGDGCICKRSLASTGNLKI